MATFTEMADSGFRIDGAGAALEAEFAELLAGHLARHYSLTAWDRHCLASAMRLMCLGLYDEAFGQMTQIRWPTELSPTTVPFGQRSTS
jgi:hypothetical protein